MATNRELYRRLNLTESATASEIEASYQRLIEEYPEASEERKKLHEAYSILSDMDRRARYDITGAIGSNRKRKGVLHGGMIDKIRHILNTLFLVGAALSALFYILYLSGHSVTPFYISCSISLAIKVLEYISRLLP